MVVTCMGVVVDTAIRTSLHNLLEVRQNYLHSIPLLLLDNPCITKLNYIVGQLCMSLPHSRHIFLPHIKWHLLGKLISYNKYTMIFLCIVQGSCKHRASLMYFLFFSNKNSMLDILKETYFL